MDTYISIRVYACVYMYNYIGACVTHPIGCVCVCVCVRVHVCVCVCALVNVQALPSSRHSSTVAVDIYVLVHRVFVLVSIVNAMYSFMPVSIGRSSGGYPV